VEDNRCFEGSTVLTFGVEDYAKQPASEALNCYETRIRPYGIISPHIIWFIITAVKGSNLREVSIINYDKLESLTLKRKVLQFSKQI
jgi:hypothetical protein